MQQFSTLGRHVSRNGNKVTIENCMPTIIKMTTYKKTQMPISKCTVNNINKTIAKRLLLSDYERSHNISLCHYYYNIYK